MRKSTGYQGVISLIISGIKIGAANEARTRDPQLGKLMLYQLSYYRMPFDKAKLRRFFDFATKELPLLN